MTAFAGFGAFGGFAGAPFPGFFGGSGMPGMPGTWTWSFIVRVLSVRVSVTCVSISGNLAIAVAADHRAKGLTTDPLARLRHSRVKATMLREC